MASSTSTPLQEWLVIVPDHAGALQKRIAARPKHLEGLGADREDFWLWGGMLSTLNVPKFHHTPVSVILQVDFGRNANPTSDQT